LAWPVSVRFSKDPPALEAGEAVLVGCAGGGDQSVRLLVAVGELVVLAALVAGDDDRVLVVLVDADEAEVGQGAEVGGPQVLLDLVVAGRFDLAVRAASGFGDPHQVAAFVGQREKLQAV